MLCLIVPIKSVLTIRSEPQRDKTYLLKYALNEDSNQPARSRSLIWVFVVRMKNPSLAIQNGSV